ncbi:CDP-alcohol phosphatidyltransferase family protein [Alkalihalobacillus sp. 1P02AB]|uniref:CDP-alcohol phosphatidyltransferase family protein n=1 Tax=Alkalihalobacillus sp. 1P02AB TaxID=3132260 RepID=UPI0039A7796F
MKSQMGKLPTTFFDTKKIISYREKSQTYSAKEDLWSWFVLRRLSIYVTLLFIKLKLTPNVVSWLSFLGIIFSGFFMLISTPLAFIIAFVSYNLGYLFDCVDGEIARLTGNTSKKGFFIDMLIQAATIPVFISFVMSLLVLRGYLHLSVLESILLYVLIVVSIMSLLIPLSYQITINEGMEQDPVNKIRAKSFFFTIVGFLLGLPGFYATLLILVLFEWITGLSLIPIYILFFLIILMMKVIARLYITLNSI